MVGSVRIVRNGKIMENVGKMVQNCKEAYYIFI